MNKKSYAVGALIMLILIVTVSAGSVAAVTAAHLSLPATENSNFLTIDGKHYAMNPTMLPVTIDDELDISVGMNPTMLPAADDVTPDFSVGMNPTMLPVAVDYVPDFSVGMNPTMLPE